MIIGFRLQNGSSHINECCLFKGTPRHSGQPLRITFINRRHCPIRFPCPSNKCDVEPSLDTMTFVHDMNESNTVLDLSTCTWELLVIMLAYALELYSWISIETNTCTWHQPCVNQNSCWRTATLLANARSIIRTSIFNHVMLLRLLWMEANIPMVGHCLAHCLLISYLHYYLKKEEIQLYASILMSDATKINFKILISYILLIELDSFGCFDRRCCWIDVQLTCTLTFIIVHNSWRHPWDYYHCKSRIYRLICE